MRGAMVLLACGWLLMTPPIRDGRYDDKAPPSYATWDHYGSYDSAKDCQERLLAPQTTAKLREWGRCIPSDWLKPAN